MLLGLFSVAVWYFGRCLEENSLAVPTRTVGIEDTAFVWRASRAGKRLVTSLPTRTENQNGDSAARQERTGLGLILATAGIFVQSK